ncbi:MAG: hypothetical protein ACPGJF_17505 [Sinimarinibacterium flocculans]|uniref:hypothetical protein n=1 Tax=Sinimarinibacterium flocculans TaxID=985250 RepID=UPI003C65BC88
MRVTDLYKLFRRLLAASETTVSEDERELRMPDATKVIRAAQERKKAPPSAGRLALLLQRIATDSAVLAGAQVDELATALKVFDGPIADPVALARRSSDALVNALITARLALMLSFPARWFVSASQGEHLPRRVWLRVGPHPDRIRLPADGGELLNGIRSGHYSRSAVRALAYVLGVSAPRTLLEFEGVHAGRGGDAEGALAQIAGRAAAVIELFASYRLGDGVYAVLDVKPYRGLQARDAEDDEPEVPVEAPAGVPEASRRVELLSRHRDVA